MSTTPTPRIDPRRRILTVNLTLTVDSPADERVLAPYVSRALERIGHMPEVWMGDMASPWIMDIKDLNVPPDLCGWHGDVQVTAEYRHGYQRTTQPQEPT